MFWLGVVVGGIVVGAICLAVGYGLGKKKKIEAQVSTAAQKAQAEAQKIVNKI